MRDNDLASWFLWSKKNGGDYLPRMTKLLVFNAKYGHLSRSDQMQMTLRELNEWATEVGEIMEQEREQFSRDFNF